MVTEDFGQVIPWETLKANKIMDDLFWEARCEENSANLGSRTRKKGEEKESCGRIKTEKKFATRNRNTMVKKLLLLAPPASCEYGAGLVTDTSTLASELD
jgi:hypothetical protein